MFVTSAEAIRLLNQDQVVAIPTETVYGLAAKISSQSALEKIFSVKKRPFFDPLIVHVSSIDQAKKLTTDWSDIVQCLAEKFWPGPLTLVLPKNSLLVSDLITSGLNSVGLRWPQHLIAQQIISAIGEPLAAPSANLFGHTSPSEAIHVESEFQSSVPVVDGGSSQIGIESTVLLIQQQTLSILRPGHITKKDIELCLNQSQMAFTWDTKVEKKLSPGHMKHHYMPSKPLFGITSSFKGDVIQKTNELLLQLPDMVEGVAIKKPQKIQKVIPLVLPKVAQHAARLLYSELRRLENSSADAIVFQIEDLHSHVDWEAVLERIMKACVAVVDS